jgi:hypothetical protein
VIRCSDEVPLTLVAEGQTEALIARHQMQFTARHGEPMGEDNVWLAGCVAEIRALLSPWTRSASTRTGNSVQFAGQARPTAPNHGPWLTRREAATTPNTRVGKGTARGWSGPGGANWIGEGRRLLQRCSSTLLPWSSGGAGERIEQLILVATR